MSWAIMNRRTKWYVYGTDWDRNGPPVQRTHYDMALMFETEEVCRAAMRARRCGRDYKPVEVHLCTHAGKGFCGL